MAPARSYDATAFRFVVVRRVEIYGPECIEEFHLFSPSDVFIQGGIHCFFFGFVPSRTASFFD
jgi:hypothetical protein